MVLQFGTLIFSIVPRFSEKCVTVTLSLTDPVVKLGVFMPFVDIFVSMSCGRSSKINGASAANGDCTGDGDDNDNSFDWFVFLFKFDEPGKFNVSLSPPYILYWFERWQVKDLSILFIQYNTTSDKSSDKCKQNKNKIKTNA